MTGRAPLRLTRRHSEALSAFARAYLHEDAVAEYGGAIGAAKAFAADATDEDRHRVSAALARSATRASRLGSPTLARRAQSTSCRANST